MSQGGRKGANKVNGRVTQPKPKALKVNGGPSKRDLALANVAKAKTHYMEQLSKVFADFINSASWITETGKPNIEFLSECSFSGSVLDLGCGNTLFTHMMARQFPKNTYYPMDAEPRHKTEAIAMKNLWFRNLVDCYLGRILDPADKEIEQRTEWLFDNFDGHLTEPIYPNLTKSIKVGDITNFPPLPKPIDVITCFKTVKFLKDARNFFQQCSRNIKLDGSLIFDVNNPIIIGPHSVFNSQIDKSLTNDPISKKILDDAKQYGDDAELLQAFLIEAALNGFELQRIGANYFVSIDDFNKARTGHGIEDLMTAIDDGFNDFDYDRENASTHSPSFLYFEFKKVDGIANVVTVSELEGILFKPDRIYDTISSTLEMQTFQRQPAFPII